MSIVQNKKAFHDYFIEEKYEAGIVLEGWEVKAIRDNRTNLKEAYVIIQRGEIYLIGCHITPMGAASTHIRPDAIRTRKLLLHDEEIAKLKYHCQYVIVDRLRSVGDEFKSDEAAKPRQSVNAGGASSLRVYDDNAGKRAPQPSSILGTLKTIMRETFASRPKPGGRRREHPGSHHSDGESTAAARARGAGVRARYYA